MKNKEVVLFDIETTGTDKTRDRIIEFAALVYDWDVLLNLPCNITSEEFVKHAKQKIKQFFLPDDGTESSIGAYSKHRLSRKELAQFDSFEPFAPVCVELFTGRDTISYNGVSFDIPFISREVGRYGFTIPFEANEHYDSFATELEINGNTLEACFERYTKDDFASYGLSAHDAFSDIVATGIVFNHQNNLLGELQKPKVFVTDDGFLKIQEFEGKDEIVFAAGKNRGIPVKHVVASDISYINWCLSADFSNRTKAIIGNFKRLYSTD